MQKTENISNEWIIAAIIVVAGLLYLIRQNIIDIRNYFVNLFGTLGFYSIVGGIVIVIFLVLWLITHIFYKGVKLIDEKVSDLKYEAKNIVNETNEIEDIIGANVDNSKEKLTIYIEEIDRKIKFCRLHKQLFHYVNELKKQKAKALELLEELKRDERYNEKLRVIEEIKKKTEETKEIREKALMLKKEAEGEKEEYISSKLNMFFNSVFEKKGLSEEEIEILKKNGYIQSNEFCVYRKKFITVLVKPEEKNHSPTHEFLVWNVRKLLEKIKDVKNIDYHLTKYPDITFKYHNKKYALEIERGSLLRKQKQLDAKVKYLTNIYKDRWMFIVSNKNRLYQYKKYGFSTPRNQVCENLAKMLKIPHPLF